MNCEWVKANAALYVYDELGDDARHELERHVERCPVCAVEVKAERDLRAMMSALPAAEPSANLLAAARIRLQEALESEQQSTGWRRFTFDLAGWLHQVRFSPALAAVIFMIGLSSGILTTYRMVSGAGGQPVARGPRPLVAAEASIAGIRAINPDPNSNQVEIKYDTLTPQALQGSLDDPRIQQLLLFAARNNLNTGVRIDSINLLTRKPEDSRIREALMYALRYDRNPGVRLKAIDGLAPYVAEDTRVRDAMLEALVNDANPGVRTRAIRILQTCKVDSSVRQVLRQLADKDQNEYIRRESQRLLATLPEID